MNNEEVIKKSKCALGVLILSVFGSAIMIACSDDGDALKGEIWPKYGYLFTRDDSGDTVYVVGKGLTSPYSAKFPIQDDTKKWTIALPSSGKGVVIHNGRDAYWSIDSAFHPGLNVKQRFIETRTITDSKFSDYNRFIYHKSGDGKTFYIESVKFPGYYVTGLGHAESGRGLRLREQSNGSWDFWVGVD